MKKKNEIEDKGILKRKEDHGEKEMAERTEDFHKRIIDKKDFENKSDVEKV